MGPLRSGSPPNQSLQPVGLPLLAGPVGPRQEWNDATRNEHGMLPVLRPWGRVPVPRRPVPQEERQ